MDKEIIKYNIKDFKKMQTLDDFYKPLRLYDRLMSNEITVFDVHMDREECEMLDDFMKNTMRKKMKKLYTEKYIDISVGMHWLNYSPNTNNPEVPKGELWVYREERK